MFVGGWVGGWVGSRYVGKVVRCPPQSQRTSALKNMGKNLMVRPEPSAMTRSVRARRAGMAPPRTQPARQPGPPASSSSAGAAGNTEGRVMDALREILVR